MELDATDVINRLTQELTQATQRAIIAEAQLHAANIKLQEYEDNNDGS